MDATQLLQHVDTGRLWPTGAGDAFTDIPAAYQAALAVRALRLARGEQPGPAVRHGGQRVGRQLGHRIKAQPCQSQRTTGAQFV